MPHCRFRAAYTAGNALSVNFTCPSKFRAAYTAGNEILPAYGMGIKFRAAYTAGNSSAKVRIANAINDVKEQGDQTPIFGSCCRLA